MTTTPDVTYPRPVAARLVVRLDNGEEWDATSDDLARFGHGNRSDLYARAAGLLLEALGAERWRDIDEDHVAHDIRYLIECALSYEHSPWADADGNPWTGEDASVDHRARIRDALLTDPDTAPDMGAIHHALRLAQTVLDVAGSVNDDATRKIDPALLEATNTAISTALVKDWYPADLTAPAGETNTSQDGTAR